MKVNLSRMIDTLPSIVASFKPYTDQYGMITNNNQGISTQNGNLFTAHYVYGLFVKNLLNDEEKQRLLSVYSNNMMPNTGILCRLPVSSGSIERQAQDDIYGLMSVEAMVTPELRALTRHVYEYGKISAVGIDSTEPNQSFEKKVYWALKLLTFRRRWVWNNIEPGKFDATSWLGRFPAFIAVMQMSLRERVTPLSWLVWAGTSLRSAWYGDKTDNNGDCLMLHGAIAARGYGRLTDWVCDQIHKGIGRKYGSAGGLMLEYFADPSHPLVELLKDSN